MPGPPRAARPRRCAAARPPPRRRPRAGAAGCARCAGRSCWRSGARWRSAALLLWFARDLPRPEAALDAVRRPSLTLEDRAGRVFATFGDVVGEPLRLADLPPYLPAAAVAVEDRRFWHHPGIDPIGLGRAPR